MLTTKLKLNHWLILVFFVAILGLLALIYAIGQSQDIRQQATGPQAGDACYVMFLATAAGVPNPIGGKLVAQGDMLKCEGGAGDRYENYYTTRQAALDDKQTVNYPCKLGTNFANRVGEACKASGQSGQALCIGGPEWVYLGCLAQTSSNQYFSFIAQPLPVAPDTPPTATPTVVATATPTPAVPTPTNTPRPSDPTPTPTLIPPIESIDITIETTFEPTGAKDPSGGEWPKVAIYLNNGSGFDGLYDYRTCPSAPTREGRVNCGTPNLYSDKLIANLTVSPNAGQMGVYRQTVPSHLLVQKVYDASDYTMTKLSYVFYNDYWNQGLNLDRGVAIKQIRFLTSDGTQLLSLDPQDDSDFQGYDRQYITRLRQSFYFDMGLVNIEGVKDNDQDGMNAAFDKQELFSIVQAQSQELNAWKMGREGSFNLITDELSEKIAAYLGGSQPTATPTSIPQATATPTVVATPTPTTGNLPLCAEGCIPRSADLNGDGYVDILDYTIMTGQFSL